MKVLVTGSTGFIGNHVIQYLLAHNHTVVATSRDEAKAQTKDWYERVKYVPFDISNFPRNVNIFSHFGRPDVLIHLAWDGLSNYLDIVHINNNLFSNYQFLKNYIESGGNHILATGTCLEYGMRSGELDENLIPQPECAYAVAKDSLRRFIIELQKNHIDLTFQWMRLFYMYGEGQTIKSILPQLEAAIKSGDRVFNMSGGEQLRDYLPVHTVAEYISRVALQKEIKGIINCCNGTPISVRKIVEDFIKVNNYSIDLNLGYYPYPNYETMGFWGNNNKLKNALNFC
jgi:dTDP-6-deoxy-L-talose 4-dehydrogenase (NAD+)